MNYKVENYETESEYKRKLEAFFEDTLMEEFCLTMNIYFAFPKVIPAQRLAGIGIVGTAKFR